jgi:hypothetical protein
MKKLFFSALIAIVAVGGAYAQYTTTPGGASQFDCDDSPTVTCRVQFSGQTIYIAGTSTPVSESVLDLHYNP